MRINKTQVRKEFTNQLIINHGRKLQGAFLSPEQPVDLCKKLRRIENKLNRLFTDHCNIGEKPGDEAIIERAEKSIKKILPEIGKALYINHDPRGYSLKIREDKAKEIGILTDWGGYGILAPDFSDTQNYLETFQRITKIEVNACKWFDSENGNTYHAVKVYVYYSGDPTPSRTYSQGLTYGYDRYFMETASKLLVNSCTVPQSFNIYRSDIVEDQSFQVKTQNKLNKWLEQ